MSRGAVGIAAICLCVAEAMTPPGAMAQRPSVVDPAERALRVTHLRSQPPTATGVAWRWNVPGGLPVPKVPDDNPMSAAKVELGRRLFYDTMLTGTVGFSCASCHIQALAFTDGKARSVGVTGEMHPRSSMSLVNVAYQSALTWADSSMHRLEDQAAVPMFGEHPVEMGLNGKRNAIIARLRTQPRYRALIAAAYPDQAGHPTQLMVAQSLASFQRTMLSAGSAYDRDRRGDTTALTASARRGYGLFFSERMECFHCHGGPLFAGTVDYVGRIGAAAPSSSRGLYDLGGCGGPPPPNTDVHGIVSNDPSVRIKAPSLRNVAVTGPYMHDGRMATLEEVLDRYAITGSNSPKNECSPSADEKRDLVAFLTSLTDDQFLTNPRFSDPWTARARTPARAAATGK